MNKVTKGIAAILTTGLLVLSLAGCGGKQKEAPAPTPGGDHGAAHAAVEGTITASGSTALLPLAQAAAEEFMNHHAKVTINVSGGGSFNGLSQVASGAVQIGNSDVEPTGDQAKGLVDHKVSISPFMIIVNKDVNVADVTMEQLAKIFKGEITNWKDVGGKDQKITVVSRQQSSGSRATIVATVLKGQGDITKDALNQDSNGKVSETVAGTPGAIGYVDAPYFKADKHGSLKVGGVAYSPEAVTGGKWPIFAYGHMYTKGEAAGATKAFIDFIMSKEFQEGPAKQLGFIPITAMK